MKKLILFIALLATGSGYSQDLCYTPAGSDYKELVLDTYRDLDMSGYQFCVKIYIHVVRRSDGTGGQSVANVNEALGYLHNAFNPHGIYFMWNLSINYINDTYIFDHPQSIIYTIHTYDHDDGVDIYLFDDDWEHVGGYGLGLASGIGEDPAKLMVAGSWDDIPMVRSYVLAHEMGHVLFLWHTHHGTVEEDILLDPDQCPECVNGFNAAYCGDYITDTPADPNMGMNVDDVYCNWLGSGVDECSLLGTPYNPDELNIMSYTYPSCMDYFTTGQANRMKKAMTVIPHLQELSSFTLGSFPCITTNSLIYYPNPADDLLYLDLREKPYDTYTYRIYDMNAVLKISGQCHNELKAIDVSGLNPGLHFLYFYEREEVIIKTLIII